MNVNVRTKQIENDYYYYYYYYYYYACLGFCSCIRRAQVKVGLINLNARIEGVPGGTCQTSGGCSLC